MARNWGGSGIQERFLPEEILIRRYGNFFLTNIRLGRYRTWKSDFVFYELSSLKVSESRNTTLKIITVLVTVVITSLFLVAFLMDPVFDLNFFFQLANATFTLVMFYYIAIFLEKGKYMIETRDGEKIGAIRTRKLKMGLEFVKELDEYLYTRSTPDAPGTGRTEMAYVPNERH